MRFFTRLKNKFFNKRASVPNPTRPNSKLVDLAISRASGGLDEKQIKELIFWIEDEISNSIDYGRKFGEPSVVSTRITALKMVLLKITTL